MAAPPPAISPPDLAESLKRRWKAFGTWGYERHSRWGGETLTSSESWARIAALTLIALALFIIGLERHSNFWDWMSVHRQFFFVLQAVAALGLSLLCIWLLAYRPLTRRAAQLAATLITLLFIAGLALLSDRANDALMASGATLLLTIAWRLTAMNTWAPHIVRDLIALSRRIERPPMPSLPRLQDAITSPTSADPADPEADTGTAGAGDQPTRTPLAIQINLWLALTVGGGLLLIAAFTLPMLSVSFEGLGSVSATLEEMARRVDADSGDISRGNEIAWRFGLGTIAYAALGVVVGLVGWLNLARFHRGLLAILLVAGPVLFVIQLIGVILMTSEAEAGSGVIVGTSGFWINLIAFAVITASLWRLRLSSSA